MNPARSKTQGGTRSRARYAQASPLSSASVSEFFFSLTFLSTAQKWFSAGFSQTWPVQPVSCQGTLTDKCAGGSWTAPSAKAMDPPSTASRDGSLLLHRSLPPRTPGRMRTG